MMDREFVVFIIGMRVNKWWKVHKWLPVALAMPRMLKELKAHPELGLIGMESSGTFFVQYWESFEKLEKFARSKDHSHFPAWSRFMKKVGSSGDVGIWHETYKIKPEDYECIYGNMPDFGLGKVGKLIPVGRSSETATERLGGVKTEK